MSDNLIENLGIMKGFDQYLENMVFISLFIICWNDQKIWFMCAEKIAKVTNLLLFIWNKFEIYSYNNMK